MPSPAHIPYFAGHHSHPHMPSSHHCPMRTRAPTLTTSLSLEATARLLPRPSPPGAPPSLPALSPPHANNPPVLHPVWNVPLSSGSVRQIADSHLLDVPHYLTWNVAPTRLSRRTYKDLKGHLRSGTPSHLPPLLDWSSSSRSSSLIMLSNLLSSLPRPHLIS